MTSIRKVALACITAALVALPVAAGAQGPVNQDTYFTFSQPVELPKTTLPAGTYFFQLMDSPSNRHIVKVMSQDRKELYATLLAIPYYTNDRPSDEPQVRFMETPSEAANGGTPTNAIKMWFYPGRTVGHEFIYPRSQAMQIASRTGQSVLTTKGEAEATETTADADLTRVDRNGVDTEANITAQASPENGQQPTTNAQMSPENNQQQTAQTQTANAQPQQSAAEPSQREPVGAITGNQPAPDRDATRDSAPATSSAAERTALPTTAGVLPLLALIGAGSLAGSRLMRRVRH
jgi:hypothetical protein